MEVLLDPMRMNCRVYPGLTISICRAYLKNMGGSKAKNATRQTFLGAWYEWTMPNIKVMKGKGKVNTPIFTMNYRIIKKYVR